MLNHTEQLTRQMIPSVSVPGLKAGPGVSQPLQTDHCTEQKEQSKSQNCQSCMYSYPAWQLVWWWPQFPGETITQLLNPILLLYAQALSNTHPSGRPLSPTSLPKSLLALHTHICSAQQLTQHPHPQQNHATSITNSYSLGHWGNWGQCS